MFSAAAYHFPARYLLHIRIDHRIKHRRCAAVAVKHGLTVVHGPITIRCPAVNVTLAVPFTVNPLAAVIVCSALNELVPLEIVIFGNTKFVGVDVDNVTVPHALSAAFAWLIAVTVTVWLAAIVAGAV